MIIKSKKNSMLFVFIMFIFFITFFYFITIHTEKKILVNKPSQINASDYSIYEGYIFSKDKKVIDFGVQPLFFPSSLITVLMKNDEILKEDLSRLGYKLQTHPFLKGNDVNHYIFSGDLEMGVGGDMPSIQAVLNSDFKIISLMQKGFLSIVSKDIFEVADLRGKNIAYVYGSNAHYYLLKTLQKNNVDLSDVGLLSMDIVDMIKSLDDGVIDAFVAWEPTVAAALLENPDLSIVHRGVSYGFLYIKEELIEKAPEVVRVILASQIRSLNWMKKNNSNLLRASKISSIGTTNLFANAFYLEPEQIYKIAQDDLPSVQIERYPIIDLSSVTESGDIGKELLFLQNLDFVDKKFSINDLRKKFEFDLIKYIGSQIEKYKLFNDLRI